jgi:hypothetical protein
MYGKMTFKYIGLAAVVNSAGVALVSRADPENTFKCIQVVMIPHLRGLPVCNARHKFCRLMTTTKVLHHWELRQTLWIYQFSILI